MALDTYALAPDFRAIIAAVMPGVCDADFHALGALIASDRMLSDDGTAHGDFVAWCERVRMAE